MNSFSVETFGKDSSNLVEVALSEILTKLVGRSLVAIRIQHAIAGKIPAFYDEFGCFLAGGDLFLAFLISRAVSKRLRVKYEHLDSLNASGFTVFQIATDDLTGPEAFCVVDNSLLEVFCEQSSCQRENLALRTPIYGIVWVARKKILLQVNNRFFETNYLEGEAMIIEREIDGNCSDNAELASRNQSTIRLDVCLGAIELTLDEYFNLKPGFVLQVANSSSLPVSLRTLGIDVAVGEIKATGDKLELVVNRVKKVPTKDLIWGA